ncbi:MAG: PAS domain S-box protein, partial [Desulfobacterales bacterium]|nr:PAS domain S-box protein [Desulfobacterales bacterium]
MKTKDRTPGQPAKEIQRLRLRIAELEKSEAVHKKVEEELQESQARYQALFDRTLYCVFVHDFDGRFLDANEAAFNLLGYTRKEFPATFASLLDQDQVEIAFKRGKEIKRIGSSSEPFEYRLKKRTGDYVWVEIESSLIYRGGQPYAIQGIARDITQRKRTEEALRESEEELEAIFNEVRGGIILLDLTGKIIKINKRMAELAGYDKKYIVGEQYNFFKNFSPPSIAKMTDAFIKVAADQQVPPYEVEGHTKTGEKLIAEVYGSLLKKKGKAVGVLAVMMNITKRKQAEEALRESEEKYRDLVENIDDIIYATDGHGIVTYIAPGIEAVGGYTTAEIIGRPFLEFVHQEDIPYIRDKFEQDISGQAEPHEYRAVTKAGDVRWVRTSSRPFFKKRRVIGLRGVMTDITERKNVEEELQRSYQQLRETFIETVNALASTVEMKDPYTAGHQRWATRLACAIAREMGLSEEQIEGIRMAGLIHDIGKINIPAEILSKPGQLSDIQYNMVKIHAQVGCDILREIKFPWPVAKIVLQHHERWDGSGYPEGLSGEEIILEARILAVADTVEAMSSHRPYRVAHGVERALEEISQNRGTLYDPAVVDACLMLFEK